LNYCRKEELLKHSTFITLNQYKHLSKTINCYNEKARQDSSIIEAYIGLRREPKTD